MQWPTPILERKGQPPTRSTLKYTILQGVTMHSITAKNIPQAYQEVMEKIHIIGAQEDSRNGPVITIQYPFTLRITNPEQRVLFNPARDANPFFHVMESIWMFAGRNDAEWLTTYNKRYVDYAEPTGAVHGAYGMRWRYQFAIDQIAEVIDILGANPSTRQAVISMWSPFLDLTDRPLNDRPCNTHIYFRTVAGKLNMTVCNRSNDVVWGMLGANAVHMTYLHELVARGTGIPMGEYIVFTNNAHIYPEMPRYSAIMKDLWHYDQYGMKARVTTVPLLAPNEDWSEFISGCEKFCDGKPVRLSWFQQIAYPMEKAWAARMNGETGIPEIKSMPSCDWRKACLEWVERRTK